MVTDISPILELILLEHLDWAIILGAVAPTVVAAVIGGTFIYQRMKQGKLDSARLVLEIDREFRADEFRSIHEKVVVGKVDVTRSRKWPARQFIARAIKFVARNHSTQSFLTHKIYPNTHIRIYRASRSNHASTFKIHSYTVRNAAQSSRL